MRPTASDPALRVVDSSIWIEYLADGPTSARCTPYLTPEREVVTPAHVLYEVYRWTLLHVGEQAAMEVVAHMEWTCLVPADVTTAVVAVQMGVDHGLAAADAMIYATARLERCELVTLDADFRGLPRVTLIEAGT